MKTTITLVAALLLSMAAQAAEFPEITVNELKDVIASKQVTLIDVNGTDSWKEGHIPGAKNYAAVKSALAKSLPADKTALVVAYCGGPKCGAYQAAAKAAKALGYTNVKHLTAGISGWKESGQKTETGS